MSSQNKHEMRLVVSASDIGNLVRLLDRRFIELTRSLATAREGQSGVHIQMFEVELESIQAMRKQVAAEQLRLFSHPHTTK